MNVYRETVFLAAVYFFEIKSVNNEMREKRYKLIDYDTDGRLLFL